jgi:hypothetical protein
MMFNDLRTDGGGKRDEGRENQAANEQYGFHGDAATKPARNTARTMKRVTALTALLKRDRLVPAASCVIADIT